MKVELGDNLSIVIVAVAVLAAACIVAYYIYDAQITFVVDDWVEACGRHMDSAREEIECVKLAPKAGP